MGLWEWILASDSFWYYTTWAYFILLSGTALWLSHRNRDNIWKIIILINVFVYFFTERYGATIPYAYLLFLFGRWLYRKIKKS